MSTDRAIIKSAAVCLLDALGEEHALGHQPNKARRYILAAPGGAPLEVMFEQNPESPPNVWVHARAAGRLGGKPSPAAKLRTKRGKDDKLLYGRHSALEPMPQLGCADLVCLAPNSLVERILDQILTASGGSRA